MGLILYFKQTMEKDLWSIFETYLRTERNLSSHTVDAYRRDLHDLAQFLQSKEQPSPFTSAGLQNLHHRDLRLWVGELMQQKLKASSISRKVSAVRSYLDHWQRQGLLAHNPARKLHLPKVKRSLPAFLKESETEHLLDGIEYPETFEGRRDRCMLELLYGCGLRRSELIGLQTTNITFDPPTLRVRGKGNKERFVPFGPTLSAVLRQYLSHAREEGISLHQALLVRPGGEPLYPKLVYRRVQQYLDQVSSLHQKSPHVLRHTYATHLLDQGADLNAIKELLGHQSLAATQVYTHNSIRKLKAVYKQAHPRAESSSYD